MTAQDLTRRIADLKRASTRRADDRREAAGAAVPAMLARLERIEATANAVAGSLEELARSLPGLTLVRSFGNGSRVLTVCGAEEPHGGTRRPRSAWTRLEVRLRGSGDPSTLVVSCRGTVCDSDLPTLRTELQLEDGPARAAAFVEECALVFAQALLARRRDPDARPPSSRLARLP